MYFLPVKYATKYVINETRALKGVCPFISPSLFSSIIPLSIVLYTSTNLSKLNPRVVAQSLWGSFGLIDITKSLSNSIGRFSRVTIESFPPPIGIKYPEYQLQ